MELLLIIFAFVLGLVFGYILGGITKKYDIEKDDLERAIEEEYQRELLIEMSKDKDE